MALAWNMSSIEDDESLATRAAWLHFIGGLTQGEVATRMNIQSVKAHRLIARANRDGLIRVFIDGEVAECVALEDKLRSLYGLALCEVAPTVDLDPFPLRSLGMLGARFLRAALEKRDDPVIGLGHGRTLAACINQLPRTKAGGTRFVSLLGGFTRKFEANPFDVINRVAERTDAETYVMPLPFVLNSAEDRAILMAQKGIEAVFDLAREASLKFVGIGTTDGGDASLTASGMIERCEMTAIKQAGARGEILGHFFDDRGKRVETDLSARTMSLSFEDLARGKLVAVAGGQAKPAAIRAILASGLLHGLLTDERTARSLVDLSPDP
ncbi:sugar-binding transcriptional regulator [Lichenihabitans psoromatis]|uniref:sugar-binding transcriptional regulator n=1 Tax=Lichenihabitans psoromatis TaxID=2528642 RepID=UPI001FE1D8E6|nr:sugar-binding transcriptional regulator [Lichenihabitans psoromatis]